jgi:hypothetical protein
MVRVLRFRKTGLTGLSTLSEEYSAKWVELLKELVPNTSRLSAAGHGDPATRPGSDLPVIHRPSATTCQQVFKTLSKEFQRDIE